MDLITDYRRKIIANSPHLMSASGAVVSFSDGADNLPLKSLNVGIEPVQDLHGYDYPWVAGGGKNKADASAFETGVVNTDGTIVKGNTTINSQGNGEVNWTSTATWRGITSDYIPVKANTSYRISLTETPSYVLYAWYQADKTFISRASYNASNPVAITSPSNGAYVRFTLQESTAGSYDYHNIQIEEGSSATAYARYENICPISGWNAVKVTRTGKNLFNPHVYTGIAYNPTVGSTVTLVDSATQFTDNGNGVFTVTTSATWRYFNIIIPIDPTKEYVTKIVFNSTGQAGVTRGYLDADFKILTKFNSTDSAISWEYSLIPEANAAYYYFVFTNRGTASATLTLTQPQFVDGTTIGDYEPYNGVTVTVQLGETVYGATINPLTGVMTVDKVALVIDGSEQYWYGVDNRPSIYDVVYTDMTFKGVHGTADIISNLGYVPTAYNYAQMETNRPSVCIRANENAQWRVYICTSETTLDGLKGSLETNPLQIVYPLATPVEIQLTPHQIRSLYGNNTIFADTGNVALEYWAHA